MQTPNANAKCKRKMQKTRKSKLFGGANIVPKENFLINLKTKYFDENNKLLFDFSKSNNNFNSELSKYEKWNEYLRPNEYNPTDILLPSSNISTFDKPGIIISTGTERSLFDLILADNAKCQGLIIRDINPNVKFYMDWVLFCIEQSVNRENFNSMRLDKEYSECSKYLQKCRDIYIENNKLFKCKINWKDTPGFNGNIKLSYWQFDNLFEKLKLFVNNGSIITTTGSIDNLTFLNNENIEFIDISNIPSYFFLDFKIGLDCVLKMVIEVIGQGDTSDYKYFHYSNITDTQKQSIYDKLKINTTYYDNKQNQFTNQKAIINDITIANMILRTKIPPFMSKELYDFLIQYPDYFSVSPNSNYLLTQTKLLKNQKKKKN